MRASWTGKDIPGGPFDRPMGVAAAPGGVVYVTDARRRVVRLDRNGAFIAEWGRPGREPGAFGNPVGVAAALGGVVYVSDYELDRIQVFTEDGRFLRSFGHHGHGPGEFDAPAGLALDRDGTLYVADFYNSRVQVFTSDDRLLRIIGHPGRVGAGALHYPTAVTVLPGGGIIVADTYNYQLEWFDERGAPCRRVGHRLLGLWPRPAEGQSGFNVPTGVAVAPDGGVHVADSANHRVVMLNQEGRYVGEWRLPQVNPHIFSPEQVALSRDGSALYTTDFAGNRVIMLAIQVAR